MSEGKISKVRACRDADVPALLEIYAVHAGDQADRVTFEEAVPTLQDMRARRHKVVEALHLPYIVATMPAAGGAEHAQHGAAQVPESALVLIEDHRRCRTLAHRHLSVDEAIEPRDRRAQLLATLSLGRTALRAHARRRVRAAGDGRSSLGWRRPR